MAFDPNYEAKAAFASHWVRDNLTRSSQTFDGVAPNLDGVVRIDDPNMPPNPMPGLRSRQSSGKPRSAAAARKALLAQIPVTFA